MKIFHAKKEEDLLEIAQQCIKAFQSNRIIAFKGEMGVGKTTFITQISRALGVTETISSPTYGYVNEYKNGNHQSIFHFDLYRIEDEQEAYDIGMEEYLTGEDWVLMEWAENIESLLPPDCIWVTMTKTGDTERTITLSL